MRRHSPFGIESQLTPLDQPGKISRALALQTCSGWQNPFRRSL
jgi:hypothetical protein